MIKAAGQTGDGRPLVLLGLSAENLTRLAAGEPITLDLAELGLPTCQVLICYGRTEEQLAAQLAPLRQPSRRTR